MRLRRWLLSLPDQVRPLCPGCASMTRRELEDTLHEVLGELSEYKQEVLRLRAGHPAPDPKERNPDDEVCADCHHQRRRHWSGTGPSGFTCQDCVCDGFKR